MKPPRRGTSIRRLVEVLFAHTYVLLFGKLAVGGLLSLAIPPFMGLGRGFFRSSGAVYLLAAVAMSSGLCYLKTTPSSAAPTPLEISAWLLFTTLFAAYYLTLFVELPLLRARLFPLALITGLVALAATGATYLPVEVGTLAVLPFAITAMAGAALVGAGVSGMLLGHWYLIESGLDLSPLTRMLAFCRFCLTAEVVSVAAAGLVLWAWPGSPWQHGFATAATARFAVLLGARLACWGVAGFLLLLIRKTLEIPQTMAATGLFYIQALVVTVGEIAGHWLLFRTGLPL